MSAYLGKYLKLYTGNQTLKYPVYVIFSSNPYTKQSYESQYTFMSIEELNTKFVIKDGSPIKQKVTVLSPETAADWLKHEKRYLDIWNKSPDLFAKCISTATQKIKDLEEIIGFFESVNFKFNREINP